jgi:hypothetical protein
MLTIQGNFAKLVVPNLNSPKMENQAPDRRTKGYILMRAIMDFGMGILIFAAGVFFILSPYLGFQWEVEGFYRYGFAGLCLLYGGWRIYRGYKKNYFR